MFSLGVEFLMGRAMMSRWQNREEAEWPPHPDRVFMALVAAWGESGEDAAGGAALRWLESLGSPLMRIADWHSVRTPFTSFVPVNDDWSPISKKGKAETPMGTMPIGRSRQPRKFPAVAPADPSFHLIWPAAELREHRGALQAVCDQVTYLGHSASPVRMWIDESPDVRPDLVPVDRDAEYRLRGFGAGRIDYLKSRFDAQLRPQPSLWVGYSQAKNSPDIPIDCSPYEPALIVMRALALMPQPDDAEEEPVRCSRLGLESCSLVADTIRRALMSRQGGTPSEWLSGHDSDGSPSRLARPMFLPLGFVEREHADGHLLGVGIAVPKAGFSAAQIESLQTLLGDHNEPDYCAARGTGFLRLYWGQRSECCFEVDQRPWSERPLALRPTTWTKPSKCWTTVTPIVLPRFPRQNKLTAEHVVAQACVNAGYPEPCAVQVQYAPMLQGVPHARSFPSSVRKPGMPPRLRMHAKLWFSQKVRGPIVIGAGRYMGFGFCRPTPESEQ